MRHLLDTRTLSRDEAILVLDTAEEMAATQQREVRKLPTLRGKTVVNLFYEDSTRTRISFEAAAKRLSADVINFSAKGSSVSKGESLKDTAQTLQAIGADGVVIRHPASGAPERLATSGWIDAGVLNAGDGTHEHPTQALLDAFTMRRRLHGDASRGRDLDGVNVVIVGDIAHSRVARSNLWLLNALGAHVSFVAPETLLPYGAREWPVTIHHSLDEALRAERPDVVMLLRIQSERMHAAFFPNEREYARNWGLDDARLATLSERAVIMHPGPMNRGLEISSAAADSDRSTVLEQVANGVSVRMAALYLLLSGERSERMSTTGILIRGARLAADLTERGAELSAAAPTDLRISGGRIVERAAQSDGGIEPREGERVIEADGLVALTGLVDLHTHLREPGFEQSETVLTGTRAAAAGGFTTVFAMANTLPVADTAGVVEQVQALGDAAGYATVRPIGAVTEDLAGERLSEIGAMAQSRAAVRVFSDDGKCVHDPLLMRRALEYVKSFDGVIAQHAQDPRLTEGAQMNEGALSSELGLKGWPAVAEESIIARDCLLAEHLGARLHICHLSTAGSVEVVRWAKARGVQVTAEVTPHHLILTEELARSYDARYKVNPPLRRDSDVRALRRAVAEGVIDIIATDHAPHPTEAKECEWDVAAFGMVGLESALPIAILTLIREGHASWAELERFLSQKPAEIGRLGIDGGPEHPSALEPGQPADLVLVDPSASSVFDVSRLRGLSTNSPFLGLEVPGSVRCTIRRGYPTLLDGELVDAETVAAAARGGGA